jgi:hypothetical protein
MGSVRTLETRVTVVVERSFSGSLEELAEHTHVWIVDTPANRPAVQDLWGRRAADCAHTLTCFEVVSSLSPETWLIDVLPSVDEHHGLRAEWAAARRKPES